MLAKEECVGLTIKGFYFDRNQDCSHIPSMNKYIDKPGKITGIGPSKRTYIVRFPNDQYSYPADKVHELFFGESVDSTQSIDLTQLFNDIQKL